MQPVRLPDVCGRLRRIRFSSMEDGGPIRGDGARAIVFIGIVDRATKAALRDGIVHCGAGIEIVATTSNVD